MGIGSGRVPIGRVGVHGQLREPLSGLGSSCPGGILEVQLPASTPPSARPFPIEQGNNRKSPVAPASLLCCSRSLAASSPQRTAPAPAPAAAPSQDGSQEPAVQWVVDSLALGTARRPPEVPCPVCLPASRCCWLHHGPRSISVSFPSSHSPSIRPHPSHPIPSRPPIHLPPASLPPPPRENPDRLPALCHRPPTLRAANNGSRPPLCISLLPRPLLPRACGCLDLASPCSPLIFRLSFPSRRWVLPSRFTGQPAPPTPGRSHSSSTQPTTAAVDRLH